MASFFEFIKYAAIRECEVKRDRYVSFMNQASGKTIKKFYSIMAQRKNRGIKKLSRMDEIPRLPASKARHLTVCTVAPEGNLNALKVLPDAMLFARKEEHKSYNLYFTLANRTHEEAKQRFFLWIMYLYKSDLIFCERLLTRISAYSVRHV